MSDDDLLERLKTALAGRYEVEQELGHGGMAIVYLAHDLKHDRTVAIKVMRPDLAAAIGPERFLREIAIEAKLSHPHILPLYDSGDADGLLFYVMPFIEGESLRELLDREQQLPLDDAVRITREVAEALSHAHSFGVVHRDIKPGNIMLSGGHAVVSDFGIARAMTVAGEGGLTQTGTAMGTPAYMSPEQAAGDPHVDGRTDVYSLGCVLYEALVGQPPFTGPTPQAVMARHTMDAVTPPSIMRQSIPAELEEVILRAMEKSPADRYRTANDFAEALGGVISGGYTAYGRTTAALTAAHRATRRRRRTTAVLAPALAVIAVILAFVVWRVTSGGGPAVDGNGGLNPRNVAVLYFEDLSPGGSLAHIADGFTEGLIAQLASVRALRVVSRNGVAPYRDSQLEPDSIARVLDVGSLIAGSVEPVGDEFRVMVRLIEGTSGAAFERTSFRLPSARLLAAQDSVVAEVSRLLRNRLGEEVRLHDLRAATASVDAWALVQRGERVRKRAEESARAGEVDVALTLMIDADSLFGAAQAEDSKWPEPVVLRGRNAMRRAEVVAERGVSLPLLDEAVRQADRALALDPNEPRALELRGSANYHHWLRYRPIERDEADRLLASARDDLLRATQIDPTLATAHLTLSSVYRQYGDEDNALVSARRALEEDAYLEAADRVLLGLFWGYYGVPNLPSAQHYCEIGANRFPDNPRFAECRLWLLTSVLEEPDVAEAWRLRDRVVELTADPRAKEYQRHSMQVLVGGVLARAGLGDSARHVLTAARAGPDVDPTRSLLYNEAYMRVLLRDYDEAFDLLAQYHAANPEEDHGAGESGEVFWWWRDIQNQPRWAETMRGAVTR